MKRGLRRSAVLLFGVMVLLQFNNCGVYETQMPTATELPSVACESAADCVVETAANLKIQPLPIDNFAVTPSLIAFNIGGDCNEAGYSNHRIGWILKYNNTAVRNSNMINQGKSWNSSCVNGKFRLYINLSAIGEDNVDRIGLKYGSGTARAAYILEVEIAAQDKNGVWMRNINQGGVRNVHLVPVN